MSRNQFSPLFFNSTYSTTVLESQSVGSSVMIVSAEDTSAQFNQLTFSIIGDDTAPTYFAITPAFYSLVEPCKCNQDRYYVPVLANDIGTPTCSATAIVIVDIQRNFLAPVWTGTNNAQYFVTIPEVNALGVPFVAVCASDALYDTETVTVTVTQNTQPPTFAQQDYTETILETQVLGYMIGQVNNVEYFATGSQQALQYFFLNPSTGEILARQSLRNKVSFANDVYTMTVYARDFGTPQLQSQNFATVTITVIRNENCPVFYRAPYAADISQSLSSGTSVFRVTATDADMTQFGQVSYAFVGDNKAVNLFNIDQSSIIRTSGTLFGRSESTYTEVRASDNRNPACSMFEIVYFTLSRNENTPVWLQLISSSSYHASTSVLENTNFNAAIYNFQARDNDVLGNLYTKR
ncbi:protocadherin Fat 4-like [Mya arenaria]|uniref:protocadherin Fat 4-like n=1 Tax=Mya arenaria TaxID=6604 RepID=UPI0022E56C6B|nr:protocadherin Fat 4-like [Mya arenaria]